VELRKVDVASTNRAFVMISKEKGCGRGHL
jgi:hypothetical protein